MTSALTDEQRTTLDQAVNVAEESSGLEFAVMLVDKPDVQDPRREAETVFAQLGLPSRPAVMIYVNTVDRVIEILTASEVEDRLSNVTCEEAVTLMTGLFALDDLAGGLTRGVEYLADRAGVGEQTGADLPNIIDTDEL